MEPICPDAAPVTLECPDRCNCELDGCHMTGKADEPIFVCPAGRPCWIHCAGEQACRDADVVCAPGQDCTVLCAGAQACRLMTVNCNGALSCNVECDASSDSCEDTALQCAATNCAASCAGESQPLLQCDRTTCSCTGC